MRWRAWYEDGAVYASSEYTEESLPPEGMVGVVEYQDREYATGRPYRIITDGGDWYWWDGERWRRTPTHREWGRWAPRPEVSPASMVKRSGVLSDEAWARVQAEMMDAREAP